MYIYLQILKTTCDTTKKWCAKLDIKSDSVKATIYGKFNISLNANFKVAAMIPTVQAHNAHRHHITARRVPDAAVRTRICAIRHRLMFRF
jgi:hypothetical protein